MLDMNKKNCYIISKIAKGLKKVVKYLIDKIQ